MLLKIADWVESTEEKRWDKIVVLSHFMFAFLIFSPFFLFGRYIVGSTDNFFHHFPNILFSGKAFRAGELGLWNPYILGGIDFSASTHNFIYYPVNWLIFAFPEKYFFLLITLRMFIEVWLVGVFGYLFFKEELQDRKWAFFTSSIYQLCGYMFFSITTYPNLTHYLLITIALYVIWTLEQRNSYLSYIYLTICSAAIILCGNIVYGYTALFILCILFVYKHWPRSLASFTRHNLAFYAALATAVSISMVRLLPIVHEIMFEGARIGNINLLKTTGYNYMATTGFVPEVMGVNLPTSVPIVSAITSLRGCHAQFHAFNYFGVLPVLLVVMAFIKIRDGKVIFWLAFLFVSSMVFLLVQPFIDIMYLLFSPLVHTIIPKMMIPLALCAVVGHSGKYMESNYGELNRRDMALLAGAVGLIVCSVIMVWVIFKQDLLLKPARVAFILLSVLTLLGFALYHSRRSPVNKFLLFLTISGMVAVSAVFVIKFVTIYPDSNFVMLVKTNSFFRSCFSYSLASLIVLLLLWLLALNGSRSFFGRKTESLFVYLGALILIAVSLYPSPHRAEAESGLPVLTVMGITRFILVSLIFFTTILAVKAQRVKPSAVFVFFIFALLADLLPFNKMYSHQVTDPFFRRHEYPYPPKDLILNNRHINPHTNQPETVDTKNYRINHPYMLLRTPGVETNLHAVYKVRSYGGVNSNVTKRTMNLLRNFNPSITATDGIWPFEENARYLDLTGCRYDADANGRLIILPSALSRFMFFRDFEIIKDDQRTLERLKEPEFDPLQKILLIDDPGIGRGNGPGEKLEFSSAKSSEIEMQFHSDSPGLVLFNDSYHKDWKAFVNGKEQPVIRANYNSMAAVVPAGRKEVVFLFEPSLFLCGLRVSYAGIAVFFLVAGALYILRKRFGEMGNRSFKKDFLSHTKTFGAIYVLLVVLVFVQVMRCEGAEPAPTPKEVEVSSNLFPDFLPCTLLVDGGGIWHAQSPPIYPEWVEICYSEPARMTRLKMKAQDDSEGGSEHKRSPKDFCVQGSNDRKNWVELLEVRDNLFKNGREGKKWSFENDSSYRYYRIYIIASGDPALLTIQKIELK